VQCVYTDKKENKIFLIYKEIQSRIVAKSYMRKGFLIYEEMRKHFTIYEEAVSHIWLCNCTILNFPIYEEYLIFFFISVPVPFQMSYNVRRLLTVYCEVWFELSKHETLGLFSSHIPGYLRLIRHHSRTTPQVYCKLFFAKLNILVDFADILWVNISY